MDLRSTFGFVTTPFTRELRPEDQLTLPHMDNACDGLRRCLDRRMSGALIAAAGTGKTALLRRLIAALPEARYDVRYVKVTALSKRDICREIAVVLGLPPAGSYASLMRRLQQRCEALCETDGLRSVLVVDEAHELRPDVLAMLRVLTNFAMDSRLVLSLVLAGQPPLKKLLRRDDQEAVARRIVYYATLRLLSRDETTVYIEHRCNIAGAAQSPFDAAAVDAIFEMSRGNLRAIDNLALEALELTVAAKRSAVSSNDVAAARKNLWP